MALCLTDEKTWTPAPAITVGLWPRASLCRLARYQARSSRDCTYFMSILPRAEASHPRSSSTSPKRLKNCARTDVGGKTRGARGARVTGEEIAGRRRRHHTHAEHSSAAQQSYAPCLPRVRMEWGRFASSASSLGKDTNTTRCPANAALWQ